MSDLVLVQPCQFTHGNLQQKIIIIIVAVVLIIITTTVIKNKNKNNNNNENIKPQPLLAGGISFSQIPDSKVLKFEL